jgi:diguanylate cyclase (GGDEF)-like protein
MIPVIFVTEYMAYKLHRRSMRAKYISLGIAAAYLISTCYTAYYGAVYQIEQTASMYFWFTNALIVFGFLIFYSGFLLRSVIDSEQKLSEMAHKDRLTGLYNRHYMLDRLHAQTEQVQGGFLAIADIDDFKKINDTYGHNAGDAVLKTVAGRIKVNCSDCLVSRWGGEEFLILSPKSLSDGIELLEHMRQTVAGEPVRYEQQTIPVTLTLGIAARQNGQSVDAWIQDADSKLYIGKKNGKNRVVS